MREKISWERKHIYSMVKLLRNPTLKMLMSWDRISTASLSGTHFTNENSHFHIIQGTLSSSIIVSLCQKNEYITYSPCFTCRKSHFISARSFMFHRFNSLVGTFHTSMSSNVLFIFLEIPFLSLITYFLFFVHFASIYHCRFPIKIPILRSFPLPLPFHKKLMLLLGTPDHLVHINFIALITLYYYQWFV